jgi:hypothetical protein
MAQAAVTLVIAVVLTACGSSAGHGLQPVLVPAHPRSASVAFFWTASEVDPAPLVLVRKRKLIDRLAADFNGLRLLAKNEEWSCPTGGEGAHDSVHFRYASGSTTTVRVQEDGCGWVVGPHHRAYWSDRAIKRLHADVEALQIAGSS